MANNSYELISICNSGITTACLTATTAVNMSCTTYLSTANPDVCSGTCNTQLSEVATACANSVSLIVARNNPGHKTLTI